MRKFYQTIVNNPKKIIACFLLMAAIGAVLSGMVEVNYDMTDYLPENTASTVSLDVMEAEFEGGIPNARVMIQDVTIPEALDYKARLAACQGVTDVMWLDDAADILQPVETMDQDTVETYYKNNTALFNGLDALNSQSGSLTSGSSEFKAALITIQTAVNSLSAANEDITMLTGSSSQIKQAISDLSDGAAALRANLGYAQYKALMAENGLDIDALLAGNTGAAEKIQSYEALLDQLSSIPGMESLVNQYKEQLLADAEQIRGLLNANSAAVSGMESYLNGISAELPALTEGLSALNTQYETFDASISQLVNTLGNMTGNLSALAEGINQLTASYEKLDTGINNYTGGVAQIAAGYRQVMDGVSSLAAGSKELVSGSGELYHGTAELYDGVAALCDGAQEMADGTGEFRAETADMNNQIDEEIDSILETIGGSMEHPVSFVSEKNTRVDSVQFVIQTEAIEIQDEEELPDTVEEELSLWQKFLQLFEMR